MDDALFRIEINNSNPVELIDLTNSFLGFSDEYKRFLAAKGDEIAVSDTKLYVKQIKTGSIIADLVTLAPPAAIAFAEHAHVIVKYAEYLKVAYEYLLGRAEKPAGLQKVNYQNLSNFIEPVAKDSASQLNCHTVINGDVNIVLNINSTESNAIQNRAKREIEQMVEPLAGIKEKAVLYWYQARNDPKSQAGDRAIIENIYPGPVKTVFQTDAIKARMLYDPEHPFTSAYIVDVEVTTIQGRPAMYKVLHVHDHFEKPTE